MSVSSQFSPHERISLLNPEDQFPETKFKKLEVKVRKQIPNTEQWAYSELHFQLDTFLPFFVLGV